jgi:NADPH-dependent F420 reductase
MDIALIGAGNVGRALATSMTRAGHAVRISSADPEHAAALADEVGATATKSNTEAIEGAEAVVLAVPYEAVDDVTAEAGEALAGKIVVDVTNRMDPNDPGATLDGTSAAEQIQGKVSGARVLKAFNTVLASNQADPQLDGIQLDGFVAGDDDEAKRAILEVVSSIGLRPIDAGPLSMARALEAMALLNISMNARNGWSWQSGWKLLGPSEASV